MTFQSCPKVVEAVILGQHGGKSIANVLNFSFVAGYSAADVQALATMVDTTVALDYLQFMSTGTIYESTLCRGLQNINDFVRSDNTNSNFGTDSGQIMPGNQTLCVTLRSALTGRSARGRFYAFPAGGASFTGVNTLSAIYGNGIVSFLTALKANAAGLGADLVILSRRTAGALRPLGVTFSVVDINFRNLTSDSQRGRLPANH